MPNRYEIAYPIAGATITAKLFREGVLVEDAGVLNEGAGNTAYIYYKESSIGWQHGDDIVYYDDGIPIGAETYEDFQFVRDG